MKVALLGYGKMGHIIEDIAPDQGIEVVERFDIDRKIQDNDATRSALNEVGILIDFSVPDDV
ncbi:4-hydroxy-tetrahydrodipicolinate reductase, partial [bacterium]